MNLFNSSFLILCVVCEFSLCNITLDSDRIIYENDDNTDDEDRTNCIIDQLSSSFGSCQLISDCPEILNQIKTGINNHTVCGYKKLEQIVCCPFHIDHLIIPIRQPTIIKEETILIWNENKTPTVVLHTSPEPVITRLRDSCFDPDTDQSRYIEVFGDTCTHEKTGTQGKYRWSTQCPHREKVEPIWKFSCCILVVCCPDLDIIQSSIHEQKCFDYGRSVFEGKWELKEPFTASPPGYCKRAVFSGTIVSKGQFPFMAALGFQNGNGGYNYDCGGTLISDRYILTAGHCLSAPGLGPVVTVRLGGISLNESSFENLNIKDYSVIERISHPNYKRRFQYNDIALLLLDRPVEFNRFIRPACLPDSFEIDNPVTAMGWGMTEMGIKSQDLLQVDLEIFSHEQCNQSFGVNRRLNFGILEETQVCAGSMDSNRDTCQGDSGGPLATSHPTQYDLYYLVGVTSIGRFCGTAGIPGVYTRVFPYVEWIQSIVWPNTV